MQPIYSIELPCDLVVDSRIVCVALSFSNKEIFKDLNISGVVSFSSFHIRDAYGGVCVCVSV